MIVGVASTSEVAVHGSRSPASTSEVAVHGSRSPRRAIVDVALAVEIAVRGARSPRRVTVDVAPIIEIAGRGPRGLRRAIASVVPIRVVARHVDVRVRAAAITEDSVPLPVAAGPVVVIVDFVDVAREIRVLHDADAARPSHPPDLPRVHPPLRVVVDHRVRALMARAAWAAVLVLAPLLLFVLLVSLVRLAEIGLTE